MSGYGYYPGCSVKGTGKAYEESLLAVFEALGVDVDELSDWNCCGSTVFISLDEHEAAALAARNLAIAEQDDRDLMAPCAACWLALTKTQKKLGSDPQLLQTVCAAMAETVDSPYKGTVNVRHPLDVLANDIGSDRIADLTSHSLEGIKVAPYYGCQIVRPYVASEGDTASEPTSMDRLLTAAGAEVIDFQFKTSCCGASTTMVMPGLGAELVYTLTNEAERLGADVIAVACPLCQFNLEAYQEQAAKQFGKSIKMPVLYFTQLIGMALGLPPRKLGLQRSMIRAHLAGVK
jgi:heterodisulfide reductase subunit B